MTIAFLIFIKGTGDQDKEMSV